MVRESVPVLLYHRVVRDRSGATSRDLAVEVARFGEHLQALTNAGFSVVTLSRLIEEVDAGRSTANLIGLTFDDAFGDFSELALPILVAQRASCTLFVPTGYVGARARWLKGTDSRLPIMSWADLAAAARTDVEIGTHGHRHVPLDTLSRREALRDVALSRACVEDSLGIQPAVFAYPHGYSDRPTRRIVSAQGFRAACSIEHRRHPISGNRFRISRLLIRRDCTPEQVVALALGRRARLESLLKRSAAGPWRTARRLRAIRSRSMKHPADALGHHDDA
jgi:peptidoglycan/xylan/chitin deacetylase (PgdA/CDA1 family)